MTATTTEGPAIASKRPAVKSMLLILMLALAAYGGYQFFMAKDYSQVRCASKKLQDGKWVTVPPQPRCNPNL